ncbi:MAG: PstS family phosphate ABC transporter substrate-binding protein [Cyanobacteriota bacterium]
MLIKRRPAILACLTALSFGLGACDNGEQATTGQVDSVGANGNLGGSVAIDGSSTVFPITEAVAEEFQGKHPDVRVTVGLSGTGGGFKKFCSGETAISNASRPIKESEIEACEKAGIEYIELPVAYDAISVVVNPNNDWAECLTVEELETLWRPEAQGSISNWNQIRPEFPNQPITLYGPGTDSGTFDYFTDAIVGEEGASRGDFTASEDDNVVVQGVANDPNAIGYFGLAYYEENQDKLKAVTIDDGDPTNGEGCVQPGVATVEDGTYQPLSRPIFIYVSKEASERPEVREFVDFYLTEGPSLVQEVGYVSLGEDIYNLARNRFETQKTGSIFDGGSTVGVKLNEVLVK